jgi:hypothetical protein
MKRSAGGAVLALAIGSASAPSIALAGANRCLLADDLYATAMRLDDVVLTARVTHSRQDRSEGDGLIGSGRGRVRAKVISVLKGAYAKRTVGAGYSFDFTDDGRGEGHAPVRGEDVLVTIHGDAARAYPLGCVTDFPR